MSSNPKIVVVKLREIVYTLLLVFLVALLVFCLVLMFRPKGDNSGTSADSAGSKTVTQITEEGQGTQQTQAAQTQQAGADPASAASYHPGVYTTPVTLGDSAVDVEVTVDSDRIHSIRLVNLSESAAAAYPLVSPALENLSSQILERQSLEGITCPSENRYTSQLLLCAISDALSRAETQ